MGFRFVLVLAYFIMISVPTTKRAGEISVHFFRLFPPYNIGEGLINLNIANYENRILGRNIPAFGWEITARNLVFMAAESVGFFLAVLLFESPIVHRVRARIDRARVIWANKNMRVIPPPPEQESDTGIPAEVEQNNAENVDNVDVNNHIDAMDSYNTLQLQQIDQALNTKDIDEDVQVENEVAERAVRAMKIRALMEARLSLNGRNSITRQQIHNMMLNNTDDHAIKHDDYLLLLSQLYKIYPPSFLGGKAKFAVQVLNFIGH
jgi:hypothetical protein